MLNPFRRKRSIWFWYDWYVGQLGKVSKRSIQQRHTVFFHLDAWLNGRDLLRVKATDLPSFERHLRVGRTAASVRVYMVVTKHLFSLLQKHGHIRRSPFDNYKMPKKVKTQHRQYDYAEVVPRLLAACEDDRERLIITLAVMTGARLSELTGMKWSDVDFANQCIRVIGKGDKYREIIISERLEDELAKNRNGCPYILRNAKTGKGMVPDTAYQIVKMVAARAGIPKLSPHDLRRIYAGEFLRLGKDPACLQEQLGHSDISTTLSCYTVPTKKKKQEIVDQFELR